MNRDIFYNIWTMYSILNATMFYANTIHYLECLETEKNKLHANGRQLSRAPFCIIIWK